MTSLPRCCISSIRRAVFFSGVDPTRMISDISCARAMGLIRRTDNGGVASAHAHPALPAHGLTLHPGYPNPYRGAGSGAFTIPFTLAVSQDVMLSLHDALGRRLTTQSLGRFSAGDHRATLPASIMNGLLPGTYFYRLRASERMVAGRVVVQ